MPAGVVSRLSEREAEFGGGVHPAIACVDGRQRPKSVAAGAGPVDFYVAAKAEMAAAVESNAEAKQSVAAPTAPRTAWGALDLIETSSEGLAHPFLIPQPGGATAGVQANLFATQGDNNASPDGPHVLIVADPQWSEFGAKEVADVGGLEHGVKSSFHLKETVETVAVVETEKWSRAEELADFAAGDARTADEIKIMPVIPVLGEARGRQQQKRKPSHVLKPTRQKSASLPQSCLPNILPDRAPDFFATNRRKIRQNRGY